MIPFNPGGPISPPSLYLLWSLFWHFGLISLLAFGGGQAVLPWIERQSVSEEGWTTTEAFTAGVGFGYLVPGPVTTMATFIGYQAGGALGALAATLGMFLAPTLLAVLAAAGVEHLKTNRRVRAFGAGAAPAVVGLLGATLWSIARHAFKSTSLALVLVVAIVSIVLAARTSFRPIWLLLGGALIGWVVSALHH